MGGEITDGAVALDLKTSPRCAAIEKAQAELRQEFDVREERRRELEFLENGGDPLDFKLGPMASTSLHSTSLTDQHADHCVISDAKCSFGLTASPRGDSVDSSEKLGPSLPRVSNISDSLMFFNVENDVIDGGRNSAETIKKTRASRSEKNFLLDGSLKPRVSDDSVYRLQVKSQAYARRNRSRSSRDNSLMCTKDIIQLNRANVAISVVPSSSHEFRDVKQLHSVAASDKGPEGHSVCSSKTTSPNCNVVPKSVVSDKQLGMVLNAQEMATDFAKNVPEINAVVQEKNQNHLSQVVKERCLDAVCLFKEGGISGRLECGSVGITAQKYTVSNGDEQPNGYFVLNEDVNHLISEDQNNRADGLSTQWVDLESACTVGDIPGHHGLKVNQDNCATENSLVRTLSEEAQPAPDIYKIKKDKAPDIYKITDEVNGSMQNDPGTVEMAEQKDQIKYVTDNVVGTDRHHNETVEGKRDNSFSCESHVQHMRFQVTSPINLVSSDGNPKEASCSERDSTIPFALQDAAKNSQVDEDAILERARQLEVDHKRLVELALSRSPLEKRKKSHWDFVLEEMSWLANDFMQERLWKTTAAIQVARWVAFSGLLKFNEENYWRKQKRSARIWSKAILEFWKLAENSFASKSLSFPSAVHSLQNGNGTVLGKVEEPAKLEQIDNLPGKIFPARTLPIWQYAMRFLKYACTSSDQTFKAEEPLTPDRISEAGILDISGEDLFSEESLFYVIPPGAMEEYRKSVESLWEECEKTGSSMYLEELETESTSEYGTQENLYEEDEGETAGYVPGSCEASKSSKFVRKKRKRLQKAYAARQFDVEELSYGQCLESRLGGRPSSLVARRYGGPLHVGSFPTKRVRTAARQRIAGPYFVNDIPNVQMVTRADTSSGDTGSLQDDQSSLHGGSLHRKNSEIESTGEFGKQLTFDGLDMSPKAKKKKTKHLGYRNSADSAGFMPTKGSTTDQSFQIETFVQHEQRDALKRKVDNQQFDSNGNFGAYSSHAAKKPKVFKQRPDISPEMIGSIPSPVASQITCMSNPSKLMKMISNRHPGRKSKTPKVMSAGPSGSGSPWSVLEDQALVVLVHDMGPNWELVSDAMNSSLQFKCLFRKPKDCMERHKILMDLRTAGDGADSADDSGTSHPYPSTLPGIPKGSARQLFQRLQGPLEEDMLKSHFEKIILIGQHLICYQNDKQDVKQFAHVHTSHFHALSQISLHNTNGILTPLDLCEERLLSPDILPHPHQGSHPGTLAVSCPEGSTGPLLSNSVANILSQGNPNIVLGNGLSSASGASSSSPRGMHRYSMVRSSSLTMDEQQRFQQYNQMISGRAGQQSAMSAAGPLQAVNDCGVCIIPGGNSVGMMCGGLNKGMNISRTGLQSMGSPNVVNMVSSGATISSPSVGMSNQINMHPGPISVQGNPGLRPCDALSIMRPGQTPEDQRHTVVQELQMQVPPNSHGVPSHMNSLNSTFTTQTVPPVQTFPMQHQSQHQIPQQSHILNNIHHHHLQGPGTSGSQQQVYAVRLAKERHMQQRLIHQQHQFTASSPSISNQQPHALSPIQNGSQASGSPTSLHPPNTQHLPPCSPLNTVPMQTQIKHHHVSQSHVRNSPSSGTLPNHVLKQRQRQHQQFQQPSRMHSQNRQQLHSQQQMKNMKCIGRGGVVPIQQNLTIDPAPRNSSGNQLSEKGEAAMQMMQGHNLYPSGGSNQNFVQSVKHTVHQPLNQSSQQQLFSSSAQKPPHSNIDGSDQDQNLLEPISHILTSQKTVPSPPLQMSHSQQSLHMTIPQSGGQVSPCDAQAPCSRVHVDPSAVNSAGSHCLDTTNIGPTAQVAASPSQWNVEPALFDTHAPPVPPPVHLTNMSTSPEASSTSLDMSLPPKQGLVQRQFLTHLPSVGGQWQQSSHAHQQYWQSQQPPPQQRLARQGNLHDQSKNFGPG